MQVDYGYMEEGKLGKPYNLRLLKRLSHYAAPYKRTVLLCLSLATLVTLLDLTLPYLSKVAIDRYILSSWYLVDLSKMTADESKGFLKRYGGLIERVRKGSYGIIPQSNIKKIDPKDLHKYRNEGLISHERFYKGRIDEKSLSISTDRAEIFEAEDGSIIVPLKEISKLPPKDIIKIRADDFRGLAVIGLLLLSLLFLSFGFGYWQYYLLEYIGQNIMQDIRLDLFQRMLSRAISFYD